MTVLRPRFWHNCPLMTHAGILKLAVVAQFLFGSLCVSLFAQENATVSFTLDFPGAEPSHYVIAIANDGHATYDSNGKVSSQAEADDPYRVEFTASKGSRDRVFELAKKAHYFDGKIDSGRKNLASTGQKTLLYKDGSRNTQATYNYSPLPPVQELTDFFQKLSNTLEFGRRLEYYFRFQKLALSDELKRMEELSQRGDLPEVNAIASVLQRIAKDPAVINVVRARAQRLFDHASLASGR